MSKAIVMKAQGTKFLIETDDTVEIPTPLQAQAVKALPGVPSGMQPVADVHRLEGDFSDVQDLIVTCCTGLFEAIRQIPQPESVNVEFGIKLAGEAGFPMLTKASGEASFKVALQWKPDPAGK